MMPILASPGEITPGQLGPTSRVGWSRRKALTLSMSATGMPSVMQTTSSTPAAAASMMASAAKGGGTKIIEALQPVAARASATESKTGMPSTSWPPLPGVTPATTRVPYSRQPRAWNVPSVPVMPCTTRRVSPSTQIAIRLLPRRPPPPWRRRRPSRRRR